MDHTDKDIEEAFCAAFQHLYEDHQVLQEKARWVGQGHMYLGSMRSHKKNEWGAMIAMKDEYMRGHGKMTEDLDEQMHAHVLSMALLGHSLRLLEVMNKLTRKVKED